MDALEQFKLAQKEVWSHFGPVEISTTPPAARLVRFANVGSDMRVLDVGCGTGVVAVTAARCGAIVSGIDLTPELLERAHENSRIAAVDIEWREADAEQLPFSDSSFDIVLSQFAHIFAPRPNVVTSEMLRVLKPAGTIAFATWPAELLIGSTLAAAASYLPPPPVAVADPMLWGDPAVIKERLGGAVTDIVFDRACMLVSALSPQHFRATIERTVGPIRKLVEMLSKTDTERLQSFRQKFDRTAVSYFQDNLVRQDYLLTRAIKR